MRLGLVGVVVGSAIAFGNAALAQVVPDSQIVPDSTLGADNSIVNSSPDGIDTISVEPHREVIYFIALIGFPSLMDGQLYLIMEQIFKISSLGLRVARFLILMV
ncbi:MAG: hypothetical protein N4J56_007323 [Chroococcidiopsis sp. SAG 2025]|uniref:hypothetical protein n=1 Tax=Chroococcidiopsis sp. SAG 2025 TaxID=171389 RepID=UPI00293718D5|nr:hypothetical protein [Chroococcidiopsis sp. SAG 2025]MDV2997618.1 hypothetical protein [Chroococcidiopsis sp. SAG 2025]